MLEDQVFRTLQIIPVVFFKVSSRRFFLIESHKKFTLCFCRNLSSVTKKFATPKLSMRASYWLHDQRRSRGEIEHGLFFHSLVEFFFCCLVNSKTSCLSDQSFWILTHLTVKIDFCWEKKNNLLMMLMTQIWLLITPFKIQALTLWSQFSQEVFLRSSPTINHKIEKNEPQSTFFNKKIYS